MSVIGGLKDEPFAPGGSVVWLNRPGKNPFVLYEESLPFRNRISDWFPCFGERPWIQVKVFDPKDEKIKEVFVKRIDLMNEVERGSSFPTFDLTDFSELSDTVNEVEDSPGPSFVTSGNDKLEKWDETIRRFENMDFVGSDRFDEEIKKMRELVEEIRSFDRVYRDPKVQPMYSYPPESLCEREEFRIEHVNELCRPQYDEIEQIDRRIREGIKKSGEKN